MSVDRHHKGFQVLIIVWDGTRLVLVDECSNFLVGLNTELRSIFNPEDGMGVRGATSLELDPDHVVFQFPDRIRFSSQKILEENIYTMLDVTRCDDRVATQPATLLCPGQFLTSSGERLFPYWKAMLWITSGHCMSAADRVRNHVGIPSCLTIASKSSRTVFQ